MRKVFHTLLPLAAFLSWMEPGQLRHSAAASTQSPEQARIPVYFEPNRGQVPGGAPYISGSSNTRLQFRPKEVALTRRLRMTLPGGQSRALRAEENTGGHSNYLIGNDPAKHITGLPQYRRLRYPGLYDGIDMVVYGGPDGMEYDFTLDPGADPSQIRIRLEGAVAVHLDSEGNLHLRDGEASLIQRRPVAYQLRDGRRDYVDAAFTLRGRDVAFRLGPYDHKRQLVIDPVLVYATYLGGRLPNAIAVDSAGNAYICGSADPGTPNATATLGTGTSGLAFVIKLNSQGTGIAYSTFFGGLNGDTDALDIAVNSAGEAHVGGHTRSPSFPTSAALQPTFGGFSDGYILKLSSTGDALLYGTFVGGTGGDEIKSIALDSVGNLGIVGDTTDGGLPFPNPARAFSGGIRDVFFAKLNPAGSSFLSSSYLGGSAADTSKSIALDSSGNILVSGETVSDDFPLLNPRHSTRNGNTGFVTKVTASGSLVFSTFIDAQEVNSVAADASGRIFATGQSCSDNFPLTVQTPVFFGRCSAIIVAYQPDGQYLYSTWWGGGSTKGTGIAVDSQGHAVITGDTTSRDVEGGLVNPVQSLLGTSPSGAAEQDAFVARFNPTGAIVFATLFGGNHWETGKGIAIDNAGGVYITGQTWAPLFPATQGAYRTALQTAPDIFIAKLDLNQASCEFSTNPSPLKAPAAGGSLSASITTSAGCHWNSESRSDWITLTSPTSGRGPANFQFSIAPNPNSQPRIGGASLPAGGVLILQDGTGSGCPAPIAIAPNQPVAGSLQDGDCLSFRNPDGPFADHYTFQGRSGDLVSISVTSTSFDTYLYLEGPEGLNVSANDDIDEGNCTYFPPACNITGASGCTRRCTGGNRNSRVPTSGRYRLPRDGTYLVEATSFRGGSTGLYVVSVDATGATAPGAPGSPTPADNASGVATSSTLSWAPVSGAASYDIYFGPQFSEVLVGATTSPNSYNPGALTAGTTYQWHVVARNAAGSTSSPTWRFTTQSAPQPPPAPSSPSPADNATGVSTSPLLSWAPSSSVTAYDIYFGTTATPPMVGTVSSPTFLIQSISPGTGYYWRVVARNAAGSTTSPTWRFTTQHVSQPPAVPTSPSPGDNSTSVALNTALSWASTTGATSYDVYFGPSPSPPFVANLTEPSYSPTILSPGVTYYWGVVARNAMGMTPSPIWRFTTATPAVTPVALRFVPVVPCRVADTRPSQGTTGNFGPPTLNANSTRELPIPAGRCGIPSTAQAYSLNVTAIPAEPLSYLSLWPTGQTQPTVSTLNSFHGGVVANAAIVPAGTGGSVSIFVTNRADVIVDINGYFTESAGFSFYTLDPCRLADTRAGSGFGGVFGSPTPAAASIRSFPLPQANCGVPSTATAFSLNVTVLPVLTLSYLTLWPTGQPQPFVSTLNSFDGAVVANAAIVPAGALGGVSSFVTDSAETILDTNGYFASGGAAGELRFYSVAPCRAADTRQSGNGAPALAASETRPFSISGKCGVPNGAKAVSLNVTVVPQGPLAFLTLWPTGTSRPQVSTLNSFLGRVVANAAIVPTGPGGAINVFAAHQTEVILDVNGYFR